MRIYPLVKEPSSFKRWFQSSSLAFHLLRGLPGLGTHWAPFAAVAVVVAKPAAVLSILARQLPTEPRKGLRRKLGGKLIIYTATPIQQAAQSEQRLARWLRSVAEAALPGADKLDVRFSLRQTAPRATLAPFKSIARGHGEPHSRVCMGVGICVSASMCDCVYTCSIFENEAPWVFDSSVGSSNEKRGNGCGCIISRSNAAPITRQSQPANIILQVFFLG